MRLQSLVQVQGRGADPCRLRATTAADVVNECSPRITTTRIASASLRPLQRCSVGPAVCPPACPYCPPVLLSETLEFEGHRPSTWHILQESSVAKESRSTRSGYAWESRRARSCSAVVEGDSRQQQKLCSRELAVASESVLARAVAAQPPDTKITQIRTNWQAIWALASNTRHAKARDDPVFSSWTWTRFTAWLPRSMAA